MNRVVSAIFFLAVVFFNGVNGYAAQGKVVVLMSSDTESFKQVLEGFRQQIETLNPSSSVSVATVLLQGIEPAAAVSQALAERPDVILTVGGNATKIARENIKKKQIVFCMVFNPQEYIDANVTGVSLEIRPDTKLKALKKILPAAKKIGMLYSTESAASCNELSAEAPNHGLTIISRKIETDSDFPIALKDVSAQTDCFLIAADAKIYFSQTIKYLLLESLKDKFPVIGLSAFYTKAGAFASFDYDYADIGRQSADIVSAILSGQAASSVKVQRPRKFKYSISTLVADKMEIKVSPQVLKEASEVFN